VNLALAMNGQLSDRLFEFFQNGAQGLLPLFQRNFTTPVPVGEIYLRLGMVNDAMRSFYEAQEAIPNYRKSARLTKRLAECNLINGEYEVARKYLRKLQQTLFYRKWADRTLELMKSERAINEHHFFGTVRKNLYKEDFLWSDREMDQMLGLLLVSNKQNITLTNT
jgi:tetratricopeptide (TPR) repeat protein